MNTITLKENQIVSFKTGIPEVGEYFMCPVNGDPEFHLRIDQNKGIKVFNHLSVIKYAPNLFYSVNLATGELCWWLGTCPDSYHILDMDITARRKMVTSHIS